MSVARQLARVSSHAWHDTASADQQLRLSALPLRCTHLLHVRPPLGRAPHKQQYRCQSSTLCCRCHLALALLLVPVQSHRWRLLRLVPPHGHHPPWTGSHLQAGTRGPSSRHWQRVAFPRIRSLQR